MPDSDKSSSGPMVMRSTSSRRGGATPFTEVGVTGLRQYGGFVQEEWLRQLSGRNRVHVWREMADNDATVGAILFMVEMLARGVEWTVEEGAQAEDAEFVEQCMDDMSSTWGDFISEVMTMLIFGWSWHEEVFKRRLGAEPKGMGPDGRPLPTSNFDDGRVGWRKLPIRAQETLLRWRFDEAGGIEAMEQQPPQGGVRPIPIGKSLLFRTRTTKGNPEGRSMLRNSYVAWFRKKNIEEIEAIGIERDLAGIPQMTGPENVDLWSDENKEIFNRAQEVVTTIKRDEDEGLVLPHGWAFDLVTTGGSRQIDTNEVVTRYKQDIATTILADLLLTGQDKVGSYAMVDVKADIFGAAVDTWLDGVADVFNRYAIPRLLKLNGRPIIDPPQLGHGTTRRVDLDAVTQMLERLTLAGAVIFPDDEMLGWLFKQAGLPAPAAVQAEKSDPTSDLPPLAQSYKASAAQDEHALSRDMSLALKSFAEEAASTYEHLANKAESPSQLATKILKKVGVSGFARKLARAWFDHYGRVAQGVVKSFSQTLESEGREVVVDIPQPAVADIQRDGGLRVAKLSIERQLREGLERALKQGAERAPSDWKAVADQIRNEIPAGRFVKAGAEYRSKLIARTETANAQRLSSLAAYENHPDVVEVELLDGLLADSDPDCKARSGSKVSFAEAAEAVASPTTHPNCTLTLMPVFSPASSN
jgi:hypothetical protein